MPLNAVVPAGFVVAGLYEYTSLTTSCVYQSVFQLWSLAKISRFGKYSAARAEVLDKYCHQASLFRVVMVLLGFPIPTLLLGLLTECIPLQDPSSGWKHNYGAWIRFWVLISSAAFGFLFQIRSVTPELSCRKIVTVVVGTGCGTIGTLMVLSALWAFPVPFGIVLISVPFQLFFVMCLLVAIRRVGTPFDLHISTALKHRIYLILSQSVLVFVYVTFSVVFAKSNHQQQFGLLLLLPAMKLVFKHMIARLASESTETIPVVVVFTVDLFNGLYVSICIQSSRSWWTSLFMIALNIAKTIIVLWESVREATKLEELNNRCHQTGTVGEASQKVGGEVARRHHSVNLFRSICSQNQIVPSGALIDGSAKSSTHKLHSSELMLGANGCKFEQSSQKMLFCLEYMVLIEYIESVVPIVYVVYLFILFNLPSAKYYPHTRTLTSDQLHTNIGSIMMYASTEMLSLLVVHTVLKRRFGFSPLYQLAFVLETEADSVQGQLFVWIMPLLQIRLVHFGLDFSFQFKWLT